MHIFRIRAQWQFCLKICHTCLIGFVIQSLQRFLMFYKLPYNILTFKKYKIIKQLLANVFSQYRQNILKIL